MTSFNKTPQTIETRNSLLDEIMELMCLKNDAALAKLLNVAPPVISKIRHGKLPIGATIALSIHEETGMSFDLIKGILSARSF